MSIWPQRIADLPRRNLFRPCFGFWGMRKGMEKLFRSSAKDVEAPAERADA